MKILFIEDSDSFASDLELLLREDVNISEVFIARDRQAAVEYINYNQIDIIILDLSIPVSKESDSPAPEHGQALFYDMRNLLPGTPIFILTGSEPDKFTRGLARLGNQVELWGDRVAVETVSYHFKEDANELVKRISVMAGSLAKTNAVFLNTRNRDLGLSAAEITMLKSFTRRANGVACDVVPLGGGLSGARVFKAIAKDEAGKAQALCAAKLGSNLSIAPEREAFELHVKKLAPQAYAPVYCYIDVGVGQRGGIFYSLTDPDTISLFEMLSTQAAIGPRVVSAVRAGLRRWTDASFMTMVPIRALREKMITGEEYSKISAQYNLDEYLDIEAREIHVATSCIHGDLHCGNVLIRPSGDAILIDYGDVGQGFTCSDPITLELSLIFHPDAQKFGLYESLFDTINAWPNVDAYAEGSPLKDMITTCRDWAHDAGGSDLAVLGQAFAFGIRQLKYTTVPSDVTSGFLHALADKIRAAA